MGTEDYSNYTLQELYDIYRTMDAEKYPEESRFIYELIIKKEKEEKKLVTLASPWERLGASIIDGFIVGIPMFLIFLILVLRKQLNIFIDYGMIIIFGLLILNQLSYFFINGWLLYSNGQTVGKKLLKIKIVNMNNELPSLTVTYLVRYFVNGIFGLVPILGGIYNLVDSLFIFSESRRCLHDHLAGTKVIKE